MIALFTTAVIMTIWVLADQYLPPTGDHPVQAD